MKLLFNRSITVHETISVEVADGTILDDEDIEIMCFQIETEDRLLGYDVLPEKFDETIVNYLGVE